MSASPAYVLYAVLAGLSLHAAWLAWSRPPLAVRRGVRVVQSLALAVVFIDLTLGRLGAFGLAHGETAALTRLAFAVYGVMVLHQVLRYWRLAWQGHRREGA